MKVLLHHGTEITDYYLHGEPLKSDRLHVWKPSQLKPMPEQPGLLTGGPLHAGAIVEYERGGTADGMPIYRLRKGQKHE